MSKLSEVIEAGWEIRDRLAPGKVDAELAQAIEESLDALDSGTARVAELKDGRWHVNQWLKKAVLLSFRTRENVMIDAGYTRFFDKVPLKYARASEEELRASGTRVVPDAIVRRGAYVACDQRAGWQGPQIRHKAVFAG